MKEVKKITNCEFCDSQIAVQPTHSDKSYENGEIYIAEGMILLPGKNHANFTTLSGYYCTPQCLIQMMKRILEKYFKK